MYTPFEVGACKVTIKRYALKCNRTDRWSAAANPIISEEFKMKTYRKGKEKKENSFEKIYEIVRQIPAGKVATYGQIAALAGNKRWSRVVGFALHVNPDPDGIPCFRVVNRNGEVSEAFAFGGGNRQIELLEAEGVPCPDGRVNLKKYQWERVTTDYLAKM